MIKGGSKATFFTTKSTKLLPANQVEVVKLRKYDELKVETLWEHILSDKTMAMYMPDLPPSHRPDKTYLLSAFFHLE